MFNPSEYEFIEHTLTVLSSQFLIETNMENGVLKWAMASGEKINAAGTLLELIFRRKALNSPGQIAFKELMINDEMLDQNAINRESEIPEKFALHQNFPNPFNPETTIQFDITEKNIVTLQVFNLMGQLIRTLVSETKNPGFYSIKWDGRNDNGAYVSSGVYIYRIKAGNFLTQKKMIYMR